MIFYQELKNKNKNSKQKIRKGVFQKFNTLNKLATFLEVMFADLIVKKMTPNQNALKNIRSLISKNT